MRKAFQISMALVVNAILCVLLLSQSSDAWIAFERTYGGGEYDGGYSVQQTLDGGYIVAGYTRSVGADYSDVYLIKTDSLGDTLWTRLYGGNDTDRGNSAQQTQDRGYIIVGLTKSFGAGRSDVYLVKTDSLGSILWERTYGGSENDWGYSVQQTHDGGYIIAGETESSHPIIDDVYLVRTDSLGDTLWTRTYGGSNYDGGYSVQQTHDGGYIVAGYTQSFGAGARDIYLIKTDSLGSITWTTTHGGTSPDMAYSVQQTLDGGYIVAGRTWSFGAGSTDVYLIKTDSSGDALWTRTYGGSEYDWGRFVRQTQDGGYIIAGRTDSFGAGWADVYLIKTDSSGEVLWTRTHGGIRRDEAYSVQQTHDGGYIIAGHSLSFDPGNHFQVYLIKTDSRGLVGVYSPAFLKQDVIAELDTLNPQSKGLAKKIKKAKKHIEKSLESKRWLDETHLHHKHGSKVFHEEKKAVKDIKKLCKKGEFPGELCERLIGMLVEADSILARVAIDDAIEANGKPKEIEKAEKEMAKAEKDKNKGKYDKAIDHYKKAWQHAMKSVKKHKQRNQMIGETKGDRRTMLLQNSPNPCRGFTVINYQLPEPAHTTLRVYDTSGRMLRTLSDGQMESGRHAAHWDATDSNGNPVPSGVYFYQIRAADYTAAKKLLLVR